ncbi:MAG: hypothetical protein HY329_26190 [Chloroflexi bacterium]|nr:hypothetical protein [Chloroflexota bacterium]
MVLVEIDRDEETGGFLLATLRDLWPETVSVVLGSYAALESAVESVAYCHCDFLIEPCPVSVLQTTITRALERGSLSRALRQGLEDLDAANAELRTLSRDLQRRVDAATTELRQKVAELEEAHRAREEFISMVAHDLGGPLTALSGYVQLLGRRGLSAAVQERARMTLLSETRRLARLLDDLADASHLAAGQFRLERRLHDLNRIVREQVELVQAGAGGRTIRLTVPSGRVLVECDRDRIGQVLSNLLNNALKYAPEGEIRVCLQIDEQQTRLSVSDEGPGIPADQISSIFERHVRLVSESLNDQPKGRGLGLYITKGIVEAHGGQVYVHSISRRGTTFTVCLPLAIVATGKAKERAPSRAHGSRYLGEPDASASGHSSFQFCAKPLTSSDSKLSL